MAEMIPSLPFHTRSIGELDIFGILDNKLDNKFTVYHSFHWHSELAPKRFGESDFIVLNKELGALIIEVKGGEVVIDKRKWTQKNRYTQEIVDIDPIGQVRNSQLTLFHQIKKEILKEGENFIVGSAIWLTDVTKNMKIIPEAVPGTILDENDKSLVAIRINQVFETYAKYFKVKTCVSDETFKAIKDKFAPSGVQTKSLESDFHKREKNFILLTKEQCKIIEQFKVEKKAAVKGGAGTGKTMVAIELAKRIGSKHEKVLFLCYNRMLNKLLKKTSNYPGIEYHTIDSLACQMTGIDFKKDKNMALDVFCESLKQGKFKNFFKHIIVDEAQDFEDHWLRILNDVAENFYIFYDCNQLIQREKLPSIFDEIPSHELTINCRNTFEIAKTTNKQIRISEGFVLNNNIHGNIPQLYEYASGGNIIERLEGIIYQHKKTNQGKPEDIVILSLETIDRSLLNKTRLLAEIPLESDYIENKICFTTVRKFKGLQAKIIILIDVNIERYKEKSWRNLMYTGCSRGKHELYSKPPVKYI
jgi:hypothetical protein